MTGGGNINDVIPSAPERNPDGTWEGDGANAVFDDGAVPPPPVGEYKETGACLSLF